MVFAERYRIERFLAKGGFGAVYVAEQLAPELRVALKVLWPQVLASPDAVEKFKLESRVASRINSDYIVRVFDAGFDSGSQMPFLVMELLDGQDLEHLVVNQGPLAPEQAVLYLSHVAAALDKAHAYVDRRQAARKPQVMFEDNVRNRLREASGVRDSPIHTVRSRSFVPRHRYALSGQSSRSRDRTQRPLSYVAPCHSIR